MQIRGIAVGAFPLEAGMLAAELATDADRPPEFSRGGVGLCCWRCCAVSGLRKARRWSGGRRAKARAVVLTGARFGARCGSGFLFSAAAPSAGACRAERGGGRGE